ncbi:hypothetical protein ACOSQ3_003370 [Xanthoceras sorbifolium]
MKIGLGIIIRDHHGFVLALSTQRVDGHFTVQVVEALGILCRLQFAKDSGLLPATLGLDALSVVNEVNLNASSLVDVSLIVFYIKDILSLFPCSSVSYIPRLANKAAHVMAHFVLSVKADCF